MIVKRIVYKIKKTLKGGSLIAVKQPREQWEEQFQRGKWNRLVEQEQPNTVAIAQYIRSLQGSPSQQLTIVDLGCGNGALPQQLIKENITNMKYIGVDISQDALDKAKGIFPQGTFLQADLSRDPLPEEIAEADVVVCNELIYYLPTNKFLKKLAISVPENTNVIFSFYETWRSYFLRFFTSLHFKNLERIPFNNDGGKVSWVIISGTSKYGNGK